MNVVLLDLLFKWIAVELDFLIFNLAVNFTGFALLDVVPDKDTDWTTILSRLFLIASEAHGSPSKVGHDRLQRVQQLLHHASQNLIVYLVEGLSYRDWSLLELAACVADSELDFDSSIS